ncbi:hypothetical protein lbkm_4081 [Lachnospiraceae bacterium KM106-2]|nr:hypothetical protein lbkm_4081 [Lachnospiraceae bacterium KM106-2]
MAVVEELMRSESNGNISFGNYLLETKSKLSDFEHDGDLYKVKTYKEITKLEKNGLFVYESVPGTAVFDMHVEEKIMEFTVEGDTDTQITLELEPEKEFKVYIDNTNIGKMKTNLGGKLVLSVELGEVKKADVRIVKMV